MNILRKFFRIKIKEPPEKEKSKFRLSIERLSIDKSHLNKKEKEIKKINKINKNQSYHDFKYLCQGYFAKVYKAKDVNNKEVAVKKINIKEKKFLRIAKRECEILNFVNSPHIIKIYDSFIIKDNLFIILPLYKIDLFDSIPKLIGKPNKIFKILLGIAKGLSDLHIINLMHGDVKPENIMLTDNDDPIIIDLGLVKNYEIMTKNKMTDLSGTITYLPPEVLEHRIYTEKMDIWALGIIMYIMMFNIEPFNTRKNLSKNELFQNIKYKEEFYPSSWIIEKNLVLRNDRLYNKMVKLNKSLLAKNYKERPTIYSVISCLERIVHCLEISQSSLCLTASREKTHELVIDHLERFRTL